MPSRWSVKMSLSSFVWISIWLSWEVSLDWWSSISSSRSLGNLERRQISVVETTYLKRVPFLERISVTSSLELFFRAWRRRGFLTQPSAPIECFTPRLVALRNVHVAERAPTAVGLRFVTFFHFDMNIIVTTDRFITPRTLLIFAFFIAFTE